MKKVMISLFAIAASVNIMAAINITDQVKIDLTAGQTTSSMIILQSPDLQEGLNEGYIGDLIPQDKKERPAVFYAIYGGVDYLKFGTKELGALEFGLKTNASANYTLSFSNVKGSLKLYDALNDSIIEIKAGADAYVFTAADNSDIRDRFKLYVAPLEPSICHQYGVLTISGYKGQNVVVKTMDGVEKINKAIDEDVKIITLDELTAGEQYKVVLNGQEMIIRK